MITTCQKLTLNVPLGNRLICSTVKISQKLQPKPRNKFSFNTNLNEFLNSFSNSLIKPFFNNEKFYVLKPFLYPRNYLKCTYNFVIDNDVAKDIAEKILSDSNKGKTHIIEGNPGLGLITINLINSGVSNVLVFDNSPVLEFSVLQLLQKYPNRVTRLKYNMNKNPERVILKALDVTEQDDLVTFIGITTKFNFLRYLVFTIKKYELWEFNMNIYLLINAEVLNAYKYSGKNLKKSLFWGFQALFIIEEVASYPFTAFLPPLLKDNENLYLVRLKRNQDLFKILRKEELKHYFDFIYLLGSTHKNFVIKTLEKWLPDCGLHLISKGISTTTQAQDLSFHETIVLFNFVKESTEYEEFKTFSSDILVK